MKKRRPRAPFCRSPRRRISERAIACEWRIANVACLPELVAARHAFLHLHLECWRAEGEPVLIYAIEQETLMFRREILEPFYSLVIWCIADWYGNINILTVPIEPGSEEDDFGLIGAEPLW